MNQMIGVTAKEDIFPEYRNTPIGRLLEYHNLNRALDAHPQAQLLVGMCMDNRKYLRMPENFAYILRTGGANLRFSEFHVSYAIGVGGVRAVALIGHTQCGMVNLKARREAFVQGLIDHAGWERERAEEHFVQLSPLAEIGDEMKYTSSEAKSLQMKYPQVQIAPLIYRVEDNLLYQIQET